MSRIGKEPIAIPAGVTITIDKSNVVTVKGAKGELTQQIDADLTMEINDGTAVISRPTDQLRHKSIHGLFRSLVNNMVIGVSEGYTKEMELVGVGYRAGNTGNLLELTLGFSHPIFFYIPNELKLETKME
ncbi:MAG: 50S ribosomal protein L6, partial [Saprospiraceae bacterium]